jgi:hypothetical protein
MVCPAPAAVVAAAGGATFSLFSGVVEQLASRINAASALREKDRKHNCSKPFARRGEFSVMSEVYNSHCVIRSGVRNGLGVFSGFFSLRHRHRHRLVDVAEEEKRRCAAWDTGGFG